jgi:hypothetical protein
MPTQVSPPPAPPVLVSCSAQVASPMLVALRTKVSAGTQITPHHQIDHQHHDHTDKQLRKLAQHAHHAAPQMKQTNTNDSTRKHRSASVCQGTYMSPLGAYNDHMHTRMPCYSPSDDKPEHSEGKGTKMTFAKESGDSLGLQAACEGAWKGKQVLGNTIRKHRIQKKQLEDPPVLGKENVRTAAGAAPVQFSSRLKRKTVHQV